MADGGYILDEEQDKEFFDIEKYVFYKNLGSNDEAFSLTIKNFSLSEEELKKLIKKYEGRF